MSQVTASVDTGITFEGEGSDRMVVGLLIAWYAAAPARVGEVALFDAEDKRLILGRGGDGEADRVVFRQQRPGLFDRRPPLLSAGISREQLRIHSSGGRLHVEQIGRCPLVVNGERVASAAIAPGDTILLKSQLLLLCVLRPMGMPPLRSSALADLPPFGAPDAHGLVGESPASWALRERIAWLAQADEHTLLLGASGTGKELAARAVHALSGRARGPFVARNAATIPASLIDAELFGNVKGYPNPGMPERPGLVGAANGGTLFLDEIGELPEALQANLLRVLDERGEYHRLGGSTALRSNFRLIGATNRDPGSLKHDLLARLLLRLELPDLDMRREDIPLLVRHLLLRAAQKSPAAMARFLEVSDEGTPEPRIHPSVIEHLLGTRLSTNVRELDATLWQAMSSSPGDTITWSKARESSSPAPVEEPLAVIPASEREAPGEAQIREALAATGGNIIHATKALGLANRYVLYRLMRKYAIEVDQVRSGNG